MFLTTVGAIWLRLDRDLPRNIPASIRRRLYGRTGAKGIDRAEVGEERREQQKREDRQDMKHYGALASSKNQLREELDSRCEVLGARLEITTPGLQAIALKGRTRQLLEVA